MRSIVGIICGEGGGGARSTEEKVEQTMEMYFVECVNENKSHGGLNDSERERVSVRLFSGEKKERSVRIPG